MKPFVVDGLFFNFSLRSPAIPSHPLVVWFRYLGVSEKREEGRAQRAMIEGRGGAVTVNSPLLLARFTYMNNALKLNAWTQRHAAAALRKLC